MIYKEIFLSYPKIETDLLKARILNISYQFQLLCTKEKFWTFKNKNWFTKTRTLKPHITLKNDLPNLFFLATQNKNWSVRILELHYFSNLIYPLSYLWEEQ